MTRDEVLYWLCLARRHLEDAGYKACAYEFENAEARICGFGSLPGFTPEQAKGYARLILPPGRRGRVQLVLRRPYEARAKAMLVGLLRALV